MADTVTGKGVPLGQTIVHTLAYADDDAQVNDGGPIGTQKAADRLTKVSLGSKKDADMSINADKTKVLHVRSQDPISDTTAEEARGVCKFVCPHTNCGFRFHSKRGMLVHAGRCKWKGTDYMERILECRGDKVYKREYKIRWVGCSAEEDTWEPRSHIHPQEILDFELQNDLYDHNWPHRCQVCHLPFRTSRGAKIHQTKMHKSEKEQNFKGTIADRAVQQKKWCAQQKGRPVIRCEEEEVENVYKFKYLGSLFSADARQCYDIRARIAIAMKRDAVSLGTCLTPRTLVPG